MAVYSPRYNYLFFCGALSGAQAIQRTLLAELDGQLLPPEDVVRNGKVIARKQWTTYKMIKVAELMSQDELDQAFKFTIVRNPYDLLAARYLRRLAELGQVPKKGKVGSPLQAQSAANLSFHQWLMQTHDELIANGTKAKSQSAFTDKADLVIRFEALQAGFDQVLARLGVDRPIALFPDPAKPAPQALDYAPLYSAEDMALVDGLYGSTLQAYGYSFQGGAQA